MPRVTRTARQRASMLLCLLIAGVVAIGVAGGAPSADPACSVKWCRSSVRARAETAARSTGRHRRTPTSRGSSRHGRVAGGRVFVRTMGGGSRHRTFSIEAFRAADGKHLWHASVGALDGFWFTAPAADASLVVYASEDGFLYALDAATGSRRWRVSIGFTGTKPALANGLVWAGDEQQRLVAFDARNGRPLWRSEPFMLGTDGTPAQTGAIEPVVAGGYVLVATVADGIRVYRVPAA